MCIVVLSCRCKLNFFSFLLSAVLLQLLCSSVIMGPRISKLDYVTPNTTPTSESTCGRYAESSVLYLCKKFEADTSIRSKVIRVPKYRNWLTCLRLRPLRVSLCSFRWKPPSCIFLHHIRIVSLIRSNKKRKTSIRKIQFPYFGVPTFWNWVTEP